MKGKRVTVQITLTDAMLGTVSKNKDIYDKFILSKSPNKDEGELETVPEGNTGETGFHEDENGKFIYNYLFKGFLKSALKTLKKIPDTAASDITQNQRMVNEYIMVEPRRIYLGYGKDEQLESLQRSLRCQTAQGERISLAKSDIVPAGTTFTIQIEFFEVDDLNLLTIKDCLDYGALKALGQWRNAGYGRFTYKMLSYEDIDYSRSWDDVACFPIPTGLKSAAVKVPKVRGRKKTKPVQPTDEA